MPGQNIPREPVVEMSIFERLESALGTTLTPSDIVVLLRSPFSFVQKILAVYAREMWAIKLFNMEMERIVLLQLEQEKYLNFLMWQLQYAAGKVNLNEVGLSESDIEAVQETLDEIERMQLERDRLYQELKHEKIALDDLFTVRDDFITSLVAVWQGQQQSQVTKMVDLMNTSIGELDIPPLGKLDVIYLSKVAKPQQIMLEKPSLIPNEANVESILDKGNTNLSLHLLRLIASKQANLEHPEEMHILKPAEVKKLNRWLDRALQPDYWERLKKEDKNLMEMHDKKLVEMDSAIEAHQERLENIQQQIKDFERRYEQKKINTPRLQLEPQDEFLEMEDLLLANQLKVSSSEQFFENLEKLYEGVSRHGRPFELKLRYVVSSMTAEEKEEFWQNCKKHAEYAPKASEEAQKLFQIIQGYKNKPTLYPRP